MEGNLQGLKSCLTYSPVGRTRFSRDGGYEGGGTHLESTYVLSEMPERDLVTLRKITEFTPFQSLKFV